jgi:hypothetical protein
VAIDSIWIGRQLAQGNQFAQKEADYPFVNLYNNLVHILTFHTIMVQLFLYDGLLLASLPDTIENQ